MEFSGQRCIDGEVTSIPQSHSKRMHSDLASNMTYNAQHCTTWNGIMGMRHNTYMDQYAAQTCTVTSLLTWGDKGLRHGNSLAAPQRGLSTQVHPTVDTGGAHLHLYTSHTHTANG